MKNIPLHIITTVMSQHKKVRTSSTAANFKSNQIK